MITFLTVIFFIFSALLIFVVVYQYRIKNTLKGRQSPEKEKLLNWLVTGVGIVFFVVVFLLAFTYNRIAIENKEAIEIIEKASKSSTQIEIPTTEQQEGQPATQQEQLPLTQPDQEPNQQPAESNN